MCLVSNDSFPFLSQLFAGNQNTYIAELREVNPPIIAQRIRFVPYSRHPRTVCMRVEIYGCDWTGRRQFSLVCPEDNMHCSRVVLGVIEV